MLKFFIPNVSFEGCADRRQFWAELLVSWYWIPFIIGGFTVAAYQIPEAAGADTLIDFRSLKAFAALLLLGLGVANLIGTLGLVTRRLRDLGKTPAELLKAFAPMLLLLSGLIVSVLVPPLFFLLMTIAPLFFAAQLFLLFRFVHQLGFSPSARNSPPPFEGYGTADPLVARDAPGRQWSTRLGSVPIRLNRVVDLEQVIHGALRAAKRELAKGFVLGKPRSLSHGSTGQISKRQTVEAMRPNPKTGRTSWTSGLVAGPWG